MDDDDYSGDLLELDEEPIPGLGVQPDEDDDDDDEQDDETDARGAGGSTVAPAQVKWLADQWERMAIFRSAQCSGVVGDMRHRRRGGYHIGRSFQPSTNYSVVRPDDKGGPSNTASAIDMTMSTADMKLCTNRLLAVFNNVKDPRRKFINAFNGTVDGKTAHRWDVYARRRGFATQDHTEHVHLEIRRKYVDSRAAMVAVLSVLLGESLAQYIGKALNGSLSGAPSAAPAYGGTLLRRTDSPSKSAAVQQFQTQLIKRGLTSIGAADGYFGPKLEMGVKLLQIGAGYEADGIIGPKTWPLPWTARGKG